MQIPFSASPTSSLGIEWELQLVDRETRQLTSGADYASVIEREIAGATSVLVAWSRTARPT